MVKLCCSHCNTCCDGISELQDHVIAEHGCEAPEVYTCTLYQDYKGMQYDMYA